uniref:AF-9 ANC1 homology domain-containing protein n=1 Tax=Acrobeloides nanus TaxID=290746 RepID=A0A914C700_9BILA
MSSGSSTTSSSAKSDRVLVRLVIGHHSQHLPNGQLPNGHTHRWTVFVRAPGGMNFTDRSFIDKVTFHLHPSFANPERHVKKPPFEVTETGYGGFPMPIEIRFAGIKKAYIINYDLSLSLDAHSEMKVEQILEVKNPPKNFAEIADKYSKKKKNSDSSTSSLLFQPKLEKNSTSLQKHESATKNSIKPLQIKAKLEPKEPALFESDIHDFPPSVKESEKSPPSIVNEKINGTTNEQEDIYDQLFGPEHKSAKKHKKDKKENDIDEEENRKEKKKKKDKKKDRESETEKVKHEKKEKKRDKDKNNKHFEKSETSYNEKERKEVKKEKEQRKSGQENEEKIKKIKLEENNFVEKSEKSLQNSTTSEPLPKIPSVKISFKKNNDSMPTSSTRPVYNKPEKPSEAVRKDIKEPSISPPLLPSHPTPSLPSTSSTSSISPPLNILPKNHLLNATSHIFPRAESPLDRRKRAVVEAEDSTRACSMSPSMERKIRKFSTNFVPASSIVTSMVPNGTSSPPKEIKEPNVEQEPGPSNPSIFEHLPMRIEPQISPIHTSAFASPIRESNHVEDEVQNETVTNSIISRVKKLERRLSKLKDPKRMYRCAEMLIEHDPEKISISDDGKLECELHELPLEMINNLLKVCRSNGAD